MTAIVVGGGRVAYFLARAFLSKGYEVTVIDRSRRDCVQLSRRLEIPVICGNGTDPETLEQAGARSADLVVALTPSDADNLVACQLAQRKFSVPRTVALVNDPEHEEIFRRLGVSAAFSTTSVVSALIEQRAAMEDIVNLAPIGQGKATLTEITVGPDSPVVGSPLKEAGLPQGCVLACAIRGEEVIIPGGHFVPQAGDKLVAVALPAVQGDMIRALLGRSE